MNPFQSLYDRCNSAKGELQDGPIMVDLEPVGLCNFTCRFCPTGLKALGRPGGFMELSTLRALLQKTDEYKTAIRCIGWGEPLMHPKIVRFIELCTEHGRLSHLNTNASKLTPPLASALMRAGLSSIKLSFQGTDRTTYEVMRGIDFFDGMLEKLALLKETRGHLGSDIWIAASTSTTWETPDMIEAFKAKISPLVDQLSIGHTVFDFIDMASVSRKHRARLEEAAAQQRVVKKHPSPCPEVFDKLTISWDGAVRVCCNDYNATTDLGNIVTDDFQDIWRHTTIEMYRKALSKGEYEGSLCSNCWDYLDLTAGKEHEFN